MKILGVHFAPLVIPLERRLQTLAAWFWITFFLTGIPICWGIVIWGIICSPLLRIPCILYLAWMYWDRSGFGKDNRRSTWVRNWLCWRYLRDYFPLNIIKTADLPPNKSYIFATFPHGILSVGAFCAFSTNACNFCSIFPGLNPITVTLKINFLTPFIRDIGYAFGGIPGDENLIISKLRETGNAVGLVAGGAEEAFRSKPGQYNVLAKRRKGFVRVAIKTGASLVPVITFGEPDVYDQFQFEKGSFLRWTQDKYKSWTGIAPVYLKGRGIFQYTYGLIPFRTPVNMVVGKPIDVVQSNTPSDTEIDQVHKRFCGELEKLFNDNKHLYANAGDKICFID